jgi:hypothetical protein
MMDATENETRGEVPRVPPPDRVADMGEILRWLATVSAQAGMPFHVEIMEPTSYAVVTLAEMVAFTAWMTTIGVDEYLSTKDNLGVWNSAETSQAGKWSVGVNCHIPVAR